MKALNPMLIQTGLKAMLYFSLILLIPIFSLTLLAPFVGGEQFVESLAGFGLWTAASLLMWGLLGWQAVKNHGKAGLAFYLITLTGYVAILAIVGVANL